MTKDEEWMKIAIRQAKFAETQGEVPVGAVIVKDNILLSQGYNQPIETNDSTAHAEILALRLAGKKQKNYRLVGSTLYVTLEPCIMCFGALMHARINRIVFGASDSKNGICNFFLGVDKEKIFNHKIVLNGGVLESECKKLLHSFFELRR